MINCDHKKRLELLAPAGNREAFLAAVENGADAVYLGGGRFNARINAGNFTDEDLLWALDYAHLRNVKIYITMNTLLFDSELEEALSYVEFLYEAGADALIVQDLGLAHLIKHQFPDLPLHLSTQGTVYNLKGVKQAAVLGFSRVVLARELSLAEIGEIGTSEATGSATAPVIELEAFVHGALCICYSGQCQLSRVRGGRSGNRGLCAQPCRLPYTTFSNGKPLSSAEKYPLSPKDFCAIDYLGDLAEAGITSFKIEGRMKTPEYVAVVTSIYRKYLDLYIEQGWYEVSPEDRLALRQIFSRGEFTTGYLTGKPGKALLSEGLSKHQGLLIGRVKKRIDKNLIEITLIPFNISPSPNLSSATQGGHPLPLPLSQGDGVEIRSKELTGNVVTYLKPATNPKADKKNEISIIIGDISGEVRPGDPVYKITDKALNKLARQSFEMAGKNSGENFDKKLSRLAMEFFGKIGEPARLTIREILPWAEYSHALEEGAVVKEGVLVEIINEALIPQPAEGKGTSRATVERQLSKPDNYPFIIESVNIFIEDAAFLPISGINALRREALERFAAEKLSLKKRLSVQLSIEPEAKAEFKVAPRLKLDFEAKLSGMGSSAFEVDLPADLGDIKFIQIKEYMENLNMLSVLKFGLKSEPETEQSAGAESGTFTLPYIDAVTKGEMDRYLSENFDKIVVTVKDRGIAIGNLGWLSDFLEAGVPVYGDRGLNATNAAARAALLELGLKAVLASPELMAESGFEEEGRIYPVMVTEFPIEGDLLVDNKGREYHISKSIFRDKTFVLVSDKS